MILLNTFPVLSGRIVLPIRGIWFAELEVDAPTLPSRVTITDGANTWLGVVKEARAINGGSRVAAYIVGQELDDDVIPRGFNICTAIVPIRYVAGVWASKDITPDVSAYPLSSWCLTKQSKMDALKLLADTLGVNWRVQPDGFIWLGRDLFLPAKEPGVLIETTRDSFVYGVSDLSAKPGVTCGPLTDMKQITRVEHRIDETGFTSRLSWSEAAATPFDAAVRHYTARIDFFGAYFGTIIKQNPDDSVDVRLDDVRFPGLMMVPLALGLPGVRVKVVPGARVAVEFKAGNPAQPMATVWGGGTVLQLTLDATIIKFNGGILPVARQSDLAGPYPISSGNPSVLS
jgi:hypothetical protein